MFNFNHLYYFYETARLGGVSNAAKFLNVSQPSLSAQIKTFETTIARKLFEKSGRKMQLTIEGEKVYAYCQEIFDLAGRLSEYLQSPEAPVSRRLRIGVSDQIERPFVADLLGNILQRGQEYLNSMVTVISGSDKDLIQKLRSQEIDLCINNKTIHREDLNEIISLRMPVCLVISKTLLKKHGYKRKPNLNELFENDKIGLFVPSERMRLRHEIDVFIQQKNLKKPILMESDILSVVARAVVDGGGCAFLPVPYINNELKMGLLNILGPEEGLWRHRMNLISRKQAKEDPLFEEIKKNLLSFTKGLKT